MTATIDVLRKAGTPYLRSNVTSDSPSTAKRSIPITYQLKYPEGEIPTNPISVETDALLPVVNESVYAPTPDTYLPFTLCRSKNVYVDEGDSSIWYADCVFEGPVSSPVANTTDPTSLAPKIESFCEDTELPFYRDFTPATGYVGDVAGPNRLVVNPLKDPYDDPVLFDVVLPGVYVSRYVATFDEFVLSYWRKKLNNNTWRTKPKYSWKIQDVTGSETKVGAFTVGLLRFKIVHNPMMNSAGEYVGWMGNRMRTATEYIEAGKRRKFTNDGDLTYGRGLLLKDGTKNTTGTPQWDHFQKNETRDFSLIV